MFTETITASRELWETFSQRTRLVSDPPKTLVLSVAWDAGDDRVTVLNVWDDAEAIADFYVERTASIIEELGEPPDKPKRHGRPLEVYIRS
jgi:hypothetical protein